MHLQHVFLLQGACHEDLRIDDDIGSSHGNVQSQGQVDAAAIFRVILSKVL